MPDLLSTKTRGKARHHRRCGTGCSVAEAGRANSSSAQSRYCGPSFADLPADLLALLFARLLHAKRLKDSIRALVAAETVCRRWRAALQGQSGSFGEQLWLEALCKMLGRSQANLDCDRKTDNLVQELGPKAALAWVWHHPPPKLPSRFLSGDPDVYCASLRAAPGNGVFGLRGHSDYFTDRAVCADKPFRAPPAFVAGTCEWAAVVQSRPGLNTAAGSSVGSSFTVRRTRSFYFEVEIGHRQQ